uniref:Uncharacterized protein n=1 Tax=Rhizoctonia solani TaxID=456999 RepID=N0A6X4_9AGAM|nr:hypothetical protein RSOL_m00550 [Rhizoctonia solani]AGK45389.1 hypothetical protein RSOL_m00550 [Rhizoctonia solani]
MVPIYRDHTALSVRTGPGRAYSVCSATASQGPSTEGPYAPVGLLLGIWNKRRVKNLRFFNPWSFNLNNPVLSTIYRW